MDSTDDVIENDLSVSTIDNIKTVKLSSASLTFAEPLIVNLDGLEVNFILKDYIRRIKIFF